MGQEELRQLVRQRIEDRWGYLENHIQILGKNKIISLVMDAVNEALPKTQADMVDTAITHTFFNISNAQKKSHKS